MQALFFTFKNDGRTFHLLELKAEGFSSKMK